MTGRPPDIRRVLLAAVPRVSRVCAVTASWLLLFALSSHPASAQRLSGRLLDVESNEPVGAGLLTLLAADGTSITTAVSDRNGNWFIEFPGAGEFYVEAKRMGYQPWVAGPLELAVDDDVSAVFHLRRLALRLDPIDVTVAATERYLEISGFYTRQRSDFGHFMTLQDIDDRQAHTVTDLLLSVPGVNIATTTSGSVGGRYVQLRGGSLAQSGICRPRVYVDGLMYAQGDATGRRDDGIDTELNLADEIQRRDQGLSLDDIGHPSTIAGIEVYRSAVQVPVQFGGTSVDTQCGVLVIWTRTGHIRGRGR